MKNVCTSFPSLSWFRTNTVLVEMDTATLAVNLLFKEPKALKRFQYHYFGCLMDLPSIL